MNIVIQRVLGVSLFLGDSVLFSESFSVLQHLINFFFGQSTLIVGDNDFILDASAFIDSGHLKNTVFIDLEGDLDLWGSSWGWWDSSQIELAKKMVVLGHWSLTFKDGNGDSLLVVSVGSEHLTFLGWDEAASGDDGAHNTSNSLNT